MVGWNFLRISEKKNPVEWPSPDYSQTTNHTGYMEVFGGSSWSRRPNQVAWGGIDREGKGQRPLGKDFADTRACKRQTWVVYGRRSALQRSGGLQSLQYQGEESLLGIARAEMDPDSSAGFSDPGSNLDQLATQGFHLQLLPGGSPQVIPQP